MRYYLLAVFPLSALVARRVEQLLSERTGGWLRFETGHYFFRAGGRVDADEVSGWMMGVLGSARHIVVAVDLSDVQGWLPEEVWTWVEANR